MAKSTRCSLYLQTDVCWFSETFVSLNASFMCRSSRPAHRHQHYNMLDTSHFSLSVKCTAQTELQPLPPLMYVMFLFRDSLLLSVTRHKERLLVVLQQPLRTAAARSRQHREISMRLGLKVPAVERLKTYS